MDVRAFHELALKVLSGSATETERADLMRARHSSPQHTSIWADLLEAHEHAEAALAAGDARLAPPPAPLDQLLASLDAETAQPVARGSRLLPWIAGLTIALAACVVVAVFSLSHKGAPASPLVAYLAAPLDTALHLLPHIAAPGLLRDSGSATLLTPTDTTSSTRPVFRWHSSGTEPWRMVIREIGAETPPMVLDGIQPPLALPPGMALRSGSAYAVSLARQSSALPGREQFFSVAVDATDLPLPSEPASLTRLAFDALAAEPARPGDALAALLAISPSSVDERALRLCLWAETLLGHVADAEQTRATLIGSAR